MVDEESKKDENKVEFDSAGEAIGYISMAQARVVAMRADRQEPGNYGASYEGVEIEGVDMVFETVGQDEHEDYYHIRLYYRPAGRYIGVPGVEEFVIGKTGEGQFRQVLDVPEPAGSRSEILEDESDDNVVVFPDKNLETAVRHALQKPEGPSTWTVRDLVCTVRRPVFRHSF